MSDMEIKATRVTFLCDGDSYQWITEQDLKPWADNIKEITDRNVDAGHFNYHLAGLRFSPNEDNGDAIKKVVLEIPLPKSKINKVVRDAIFALGLMAPMRVTVENYTVDADEFSERNRTNLNGAFTVEA